MKSSMAQHFQFHYAHPHRIISSIIYVIGFVSTARAIPNQRPFNNTIPALFVFGDSTVDPGNNNYLPTIAKGNFPPYGQDFADHAATGRFTNGRLPTDFIRIKDYVPPYLDRSLSIDELMTGVSFASGGTGFDPLTSTISNVVPMSKQLRYFQEYRKRLEDTIGKEKTDDLIGKAVFVVSAGTNDFAVSYFTAQIRKLRFSLPAYQKFVLQYEKDFIQGLISQGATKIIVGGLPPMGCLPFIISSNNLPLFGRRCVDEISSAARDYNVLLQSELGHLQSQANQGAKTYYIDIYGPLQDMIQDYQKYGFEEVSIGCCGTGFLEVSFLCNPTSPVCPDASKYIFWDSIHPTDRTYDLIFQAFRSVVDLVIKDSSQ